MDSLADFIQGYVDAAAFCGTVLVSEDSEPTTPDRLDLPFGIATFAKLKAEATLFYRRNLKDLDLVWEGTDESFESLGADFWFSREGHGTGFWDNAPSAQDVHPEETREALQRLDAAAKAEGSGYCFRVFRNAIHKC